VIEISTSDCAIPSVLGAKKEKKQEENDPHWSNSRDFERLGGTLRCLSSWKLITSASACGNSRISSGEIPDP